MMESMQKAFFRVVFKDSFCHKLMISKTQAAQVFYVWQKDDDIPFMDLKIEWFCVVDTDIPVLDWYIRDYKLFMKTEHGTFLDINDLSLDRILEILRLPSYFPNELKEILFSDQCRNLRGLEKTRLE